MSLIHTDVTVTCFFTSDCVLPCESTYHDDIRWYKAGNEHPVHIFSTNNVDHQDYQDAAFRGRTSLFVDQISQGNASLLLKMIRVEDEGIYTCYTSSSSEDLEIIVRLEVKGESWTDVLFKHNMLIDHRTIFPNIKMNPAYITGFFLSLHGGNCPNTTNTPITLPEMISTSLTGVV